MISVIKKTPLPNNTIKLVNDPIPLSRKSLIIEPSTKNRTFITGSKTLSKNYKFYDLKPKHKETLQEAFKSLIILKVTKPIKIFMSLPTFGRYVFLELKFI